MLTCLVVKDSLTLSLVNVVSYLSCWTKALVEKHTKTTSSRDSLESMVGYKRSNMKVREKKSSLSSSGGTGSSFLLCFISLFASNNKESQDRRESTTSITGSTQYNEAQCHASSSSSSSCYSYSLSLFPRRADSVTQANSRVNFIICSWR